MNSFINRDAVEKPVVRHENYLPVCGGIVIESTIRNRQEYFEQNISKFEVKSDDAFFKKILTQCTNGVTEKEILRVDRHFGSGLTDGSVDSLIQIHLNIKDISPDQILERLIQFESRIAGDATNSILIGYCNGLTVFASRYSNTDVLCVRTTIFNPYMGSRNNCKIVSSDIN